MTAASIDDERLEALLKRDDPASLIEFFKGLSEEQRRPYAALCKRALKESWNFDDRKFDVGQCSLAYLACGTLAELTAADSNMALRNHDHVIAILKDRKPGWLTDYLAMRLEKRQANRGVGHTWQLTRECMAAGLCTEPDNDAYVLGFISSLEGHRKNVSHYERLVAMPDVFDKLIWRIFEVEGGGEISLANVDRFSGKPSDDWSTTLIKLAEKGTLDRQRLLSACLDALNRGFGQYRAGWFSRFHEAMKPTLEERAARAEKYLSLLASSIGPTVSFAVAALKQLQNAKRLSIEIVLKSIEPALYAKTASTVKTVLAMLMDLGNAHRDHSNAIARLSTVALEHPDVAVQQAAFEMLESFGTSDDAELIRSIEGRMQIVSPSVRKLLTKWLGATRTTTPTGVAATGPKAQSKTESVPEDALLSSIATVSDSFRKLAGLDAALACVRDPMQSLPALNFGLFDVPQLFESARVRTIDTFDEFVEQALVAIENPQDLLRAELVIDAAVRFAAHDLRRSDGRLATLGKRLRKLVERREWEWQAVTPPGTLQEIMRAYIEARQPDFKLPPRDPRSVIAARTAEAGAYIVQQQAAALLSSPTHSGFWIDPRVLVQRTLLSVDKKQPVGVGAADRILALLRMAPDHRAEALHAAKKLNFEWGLALRYALGDSTKPGDSSLWIAASRARNPYVVDDQIKCKDKVAGLNSPCNFDFVVNFSKPKNRYDTPLRNFTVTGEPPAFSLLLSCARYMQREKRKDKYNGECLPTVGMCHDELELLDSHFDMRHYLSWGSVLWPSYPEPIYAIGALSESLMGDTYSTPSPNVPIADGLTMLLDANRPVTKAALILLCRGLNTNHAAAGRASVDAAIAAINDGRLDSEQLGEMMQRFRLTGIVVVKRWVPRLKEVAASSPYAKLVVQRALERCFNDGQLHCEARDLHAWMDLLFELSVECGASIDDPKARNGLEKVATSDKSKKLVKKLLGLTSTEEKREFRLEAFRYAFARRCERAKTWSDG